MKSKQRQISRWAVGVRRYTMYVSMLSVVMLAACNTDEATEGGILLPEGEYPLTFTASGLTMPIATRSTSDGTWEGGEAVAIRVTGKDETKEVKEYTASVVEGTDKKTATLTSEVPYYWQSSEETKNVDAWYCGTGYSPTQPTEWSVQAGQNQEGNYQKSDFLYAAATLITYRGDKNLSFRHQTAKVVINILNKEAVSDADQISAIELQSTVLTGTFTVDEEGKLEAKKDENVGSITPRKLTTTSGETILASYEALVIPQTVEAGKPLIAITIDNDRYIYKPQTPATFKAGSVHTYDITVKANGLYVETVTGGTWDHDDMDDEPITSEPPSKPVI